MTTLKKIFMLFLLAQQVKMHFVCQMGSLAAESKNSEKLLCHYQAISWRHEAPAGLESARSLPSVARSDSSCSWPLGSTWFYSLLILYASRGHLDRSSSTDFWIPVNAGTEVFEHPAGRGRPVRDQHQTWAGGSSLEARQPASGELLDHEAEVAPSNSCRAKVVAYGSGRVRGNCPLHPYRSI
jgi:hypothetical protein